MEIGGCCAVLGGSGFVGRHVVDALLSLGQFSTVRIVDLRASAHAGAADMRFADLSDPEQLAAAVRGCAAVIHSAGIVDTRSGALHDARIQHANVAGTKAVIEACRRERVEVLVFVSSHSAASDGAWGDDAGALHGEGRASAYGRSKRAAERAIIAAHDSAGLATAAVRPQVV